MSKGSSLDRNKMIKEKILKQEEGRKNTISKNWINTISFSFSLEFPKLYLVDPEKNITLSNEVLNTHGGNIKENYFMNK